MTTRSLLLGSLLLALAIPACGGAIDTTGTSSSGGSGTRGPGSSTPTTPAPPVQTPVGPLPPTNSGSFNTTANGCSNFTVFAGDATGQRFLIIQADKKELGIASLGDTATVDLATTSNGSATRVFVDTYDRVPREQMYCTDYLTEPYNPVRETAVQGTATFTISSVGREGDGYAVTVTLKGVLVRGAKGGLELLPDLTYTNVGVGWLPG